jgi:hypothetical protein
MKTTMVITETVEGGIEFRGHVEAMDLQHLYLDRNDMGLLECCFEPGTTSVHWLIGLEMVFRKLEELKEPRELVARGVPILPVPGK